jgi:hypothetical protein
MPKMEKPAGLIGSFKFNKMNDNFTANENNGLFDGVDLEKENKNYFSNLMKSLYKYTLMKH